jgi:predicted transcriptional regulator
MMDYCNEIQGFINYTLSNLRNISEMGIKCSCKRYKNKKFLDSYVVTMHLLQKGFMEKYLYWYAYGESDVPHDTMVERMIGSTSTSSNVHGVVDDNSNLYRNMVMDAMGMNHDHASQCLIINEELNTDTSRFFMF